MGWTQSRKYFGQQSGILGNLGVLGILEISDIFCVLIYLFCSCRCFAFVTSQFEFPVSFISIFCYLWPLIPLISITDDYIL